MVNVHKKQIQRPPRFGAKVSTEYINGLVEVNGRMVMLLDIDKLLKLQGVDEDDER